jgi:murein DD-endopeptidase MepM/ murein hydrolase activator NlpD
MAISTRRIGALIAGGAIVMATLNAPASGSTFDQARQQRRQLAHQITTVRTYAHTTERMLRGRINRILSVVSAAPTGRALVSPDQWHLQRRNLVRNKKVAHKRLLKVMRHSQHRLALLGARRRHVRDWITRYGVLHACPVRGPHDVTNNFGVMVRMPGVPVHVHEGNDIIAPMWTPIVAPFAGRAVAAPNGLGGLAVSVYGAQGYAYNAHLVAYGQLGTVGTGTVIGYVGATGDAGGPHDHFEWHPNNGAAVDPYPFLNAVC